MLADMARRVFPFSRASLMCAMAWAAADESGIHQGAPVCVVAGYLASPTEWMRLDEPWMAALSKANLSYFHAREFFNRRPGHGIYGKLSESSASALIDELLACIEGYNMYPFGAVTDRGEFEALTYGERRFLTGGQFVGNKFRTNGAPTKPYFVSFQYSLVEVAKRLPPDDRAHFIFANQPEYKMRALETFNEAKATMEEEDANRIGICAFADSKEVSALQAADLLSHLWYTHASHGEAMGDERNEAMDRIIAKGDTLRLFNREAFEVFFEDVPAEMREQLRAFQPPRKGRRG
jgi:hypothetical protein